MYNRFVLNETSYHGAGAVKAVAEEITARGFKKAFVASDPDLIKFGVSKKVTDVLNDAGIAYEMFSEIKPTIQNVQSGVEAFKASGADCIVAIGGGSSMDTAKAIGIIIKNPEFADVRSLEGVAPTKNKCVPIIAVPTTAGTAAEVTINYVITDAEKNRKMVCVDVHDIPVVAVVDPDMMSSMPKGLTAATGMDALTHAVEAYIGHSNTKDTSEKAEVATKLIFENLEEAYKNGKDLHAREQMLLASHYAGIAFTRAYVGNVHAIAHNLGGFYGVPHGLANAIILPYVLDFYGETAYERLARLCECAGVAKAGQTDEQKALDFIQAIRDMNARMNIPDKIDKIQEKDIETIAKRACKEANPLYPVPRIMDLDDCIAIIHRLMP